MTDFATDPRSVDIREQEGLKVEQIVYNTTREMVCCAGLCYNNPMVFLLDSIPYGPEESSYSLTVRDAIVKYILSRKAIRMDNLMVAKTEHLIKMDKEQIQKYEGEISGYKKRLIELNKHSERALNMIQEKEGNVAQYSAKIDAIKRELEEKDTEELVTAQSWSVSTAWKFFTTQNMNCDVKSKWKVANFKKWTTGKCMWVDIQETEYTFRGKVKGSFMRGLYADVVLETEKKTKYADDIWQLRSDLQKLKTKHSDEEDDLSEYRDKENEHKVDIATFQKFIQERRSKITELEATRITISEAKERLHGIQ